MTIEFVVLLVLDPDLALCVSGALDQTQDGAEPCHDGPGRALRLRRGRGYGGGGRIAAINAASAINTGTIVAASIASTSKIEVINLVGIYVEAGSIYAVAPSRCHRAQ